MRPIDFVNNSELDKSVIKLFNDYYKIYSEIELDNIKFPKYKVGDEVNLDKGTLLHGIKSYTKEKLECIKKDGIVFPEYRGINSSGQKYCVCFWIINDDTKLKEYVNYYSGDSIFLEKRFQKRKYKQVYIPKNPFDGRETIFNKINKFKYKILYVHESKENRFMPSLTNWNKAADDYIAFIINNKYTNKLLDYDIYQRKIPIEIMQKFIPKWAINNFVYKKVCTMTDHEIALIFGLPSNLIEGILVGKLIENNETKLNEIKEIFSNCYISNLEGKVIK